MGVYMGYAEIIAILQGYRTYRFCSSWQDPKTEGRTGRVGRAEADPQRTDVGCPRPSCAVCPTLTGLIFRYAHLLRKGPETIRRKTLCHSIYDIYGCGYLLETDFPRDDAGPKKVISNIDMLGGVVVNRIS